MDRNREARRVTLSSAAANNTNGLSRRRQRNNSLRESPEDDGPLELQETTTSAAVAAARLRDRKKDRDRDRERERERDRERERARERERDRLSRSKRQRPERLMQHGGGSSNRDEAVGIADESSDDSLDDDEDDEDGGFGSGSASGSGDGVLSSSMRMLPPNPPPLATSPSLPNHHHNHHRRSFPLPAKIFKAATVLTNSTTWKAPDEMIGVSVPRKARSAHTKRSHDSWASSSVEPIIPRQASTSPVRPSLLSSPSAALPPAPASPSSSNASVRKKMKSNGPKQRPPKSSSSKSASPSAQDEIEIEIAEVLYGMQRQPQATSKQEMAVNDSVRFDLRELNNNKSSTDAKSKISSPNSNSPSAVHQSSIVALNSAMPMSVIAPKRKRPRPPVKYEEENPTNISVRYSHISSTSKAEIDPQNKVENCSQNVDKNCGSATENGSVSYDLGSSYVLPTPPEQMKVETNLVMDSKVLTSEIRESGGASKEEVPSLKQESSGGFRLDKNCDKSRVTKEKSAISEVDMRRDDKFSIDLMAPPPSRQSPEKDGEVDFLNVDPKPVATDVEMQMKHMVKENEKAVKIGVTAEAEAEEKKEKKAKPEETDILKSITPRERNIELQLDLEKRDKDTGNCSISGHKLNNVHKQPQPQSNTERAAQSSSLPLPMSMPSWPGSLPPPPMGYMGPFQGVVPMDGSSVPSTSIQPPHLPLAQPRPKKCATHFYIARNIRYQQQFMLWPGAAAGPASLYGAKVGNLNVMPSTEMHGNISDRNGCSVQEKGQGLTIFLGQSGKDKGLQQPTNIAEAQRKQILLQQALPPGAPNNILHGPALFFPLSQQQALAATPVRPGSVKPHLTVSSTASSSSSMNVATTTAAAATTMSFNYPNMPGNETQYLAILQNNPYPFPIPAHLGAAPPYRGTPTAAMPFFNGSFYPSQMIHPSQMQQSQPQAQLSSQHGHQNSSISGGSSSSQKHLQSQQQQRPNGSGGGSSQAFPAPKNQQSQLQRPQQGHHMPHQVCQMENEMGGEDSPSTAESRASRMNMNIYGQNFPVPMQPTNYALMATTMGGNPNASSNSEKKQQQPQHQAPKVGAESSLPQAFAMSFASINGATAPSGLDISSLAQNHAILQSLPEAARHEYQIMAAAARAAQQKKFRVSSEGGKNGGNDSMNVDDERKMKASAGQSIAFSMADLTEPIQRSSVIDSSARNMNPSRDPGSAMSAATSAVNASSVQQQKQAQRNQLMQQQPQQLQQLQQQQQQQNLLQHQKQMQMAANARSKTPVSSNGNVYGEQQHPPSSMAPKIPNAMSAVPLNLVQNNSSSSPIHSPQWKNSIRTTTSQIPSSTKIIPQQQGRTQQSHTQISFATNQKTSNSAASQGQQLVPSNNQSQSPPIVVGSPTTSKGGAGGSPRTTGSASSGNKGGQASTLSSQQGNNKNSPIVPPRKSSPAGPTILGNPHATSSSLGPANKSQSPQQQQQFPKHMMQQAQLLFSNPAYMQAQAQSANAASSAVSAYYLQRHRRDQQQMPDSMAGSSTVTSSSGMLSLCPPTFANTSTMDPAKATVVAGNMKGAGLPSNAAAHFTSAAQQSSGKQHQLVPNSFTYAHAVPPAAVQVKPTEQKQPAGE